MIDNKLVLAYIGNGKSTNRYHLPFVLQRKDKFIVKKIYNYRIHHDIWTKVNEIEYTDDLDDVLKDDDIDMVVVCTPPSTHYHYVKKVLEANKHCLCEKPFMENTQQAKELFELSDKKGLYCSPYQNRRYDSDFLTVKQVIESGVLGDLLEIENHFDYYRREVSEGTDHFDAVNSFLYGHGCHTIDQMISYFGKPDDVHYDVRQLLGKGRMNDYFDVDLYYGNLKVSVKSSYFRIKERPSFVVYGKQGMFIKETKDRQEEHLKLFYMPDHPDFGLDLPQHYGTLSYYDDHHVYHEEKVPSLKGDYGRVYDDIYECILNHKKPVITHQQTLILMEILEAGIKDLK